MTLINILWRLMLGLIALSLLAFFVTPNATLGYLAKLFALDIGLGLLVFLGWPYVRGVRKGDVVFVNEGEVSPLFALPNAVAKSNGRINGFIQVDFGNGVVGIGKIVKYQGLITHAEVRFIEKDIPMEIMKRV